MANTSPATVTVTSTTGPGQSLVAQVLTDVVAIEYDFVKNTVKITRAGAGGIEYVSYSAIITVTHTVTAGVTSITITT